MTLIQVVDTRIRPNAQPSPPDCFVPDIIKRLIKEIFPQYADIQGSFVAGECRIRPFNKLGKIIEKCGLDLVFANTARLRRNRTSSRYRYNNDNREYDD